MMIIVELVLDVCQRGIAASAAGLPNFQRDELLDRITRGARVQDVFVDEALAWTSLE